MPIVSATVAPCAISSGSCNDMPLIDSPPFDWSIVRGIAFRHRPSRSQNTSIENSSPTTQLLHHRLDRRVREEEGELGRVGGAVDVSRAEAFAHLHEQGKARVGRHVVRQPRARAREPVLLEEHVRDVLVAHRRAHLERRREQESGLEQSARPARGCSGRCRSRGTTSLTSCSATSAASAGT